LRFALSSLSLKGTRYKNDNVLGGAMKYIAKKITEQWWFGLCVVYGVFLISLIIFCLFDVFD